MSKKKKLFFLDFDGTLVSIASTPDAVQLDSETRDILQVLSGDPHARVAIISGRPLKELSAHLGLKKAILAGNHGLEVKGRDVQLPPRARQARKLKYFISVIAQKFKMAFNHYPDVLIEDKHYTLSIHYRNVPKEHLPVFQELVRFFRKKYSHYPIVWTQGKKVIEIRPSVYWGKADTVTYLLKKFPRTVSIAIGDDTSDEDMFRIVKKNAGIAVRVGRSKASLADYYLNSTEEVRGFLQKLCR